MIQLFYWSRKGIHVVLSDEEEAKLVAKFSSGPMEFLKYNTSLKVRKEIEQQIFAYFENALKNNPEQFHHDYVFRSLYGTDAQKMFPVILDAYGRVTKRATIGHYGEEKTLLEEPEKIYEVLGKDKVYQITMIERDRWPWSRRAIGGHVSVPISLIERLVGTVDSFYIDCKRAVLGFHRDGVRISILGKGHKLLDDKQLGSDDPGERLS